SGLTPNATFTVANGALNFESGKDSVPYTIGGFLTSGGATATYAAGSGSGDTDANTIITMAGFVSMVNGQTYETEHDDGLELTIGGDNVVNAPGPTSAESTPFTWTGASGNYAFSLEYSEINGAPAVLQTDLPLSSTVPDSATTMGMLSLGLGGLAAFGRRFRK
ncbi:MAG TPA: VPDSG-CTERM sorting domain-containing protein, partial [Verrucomicrobiae bacterium]|nr:VPDSG-CTERM sorting domain-containing protein [Verrucomicrobiae bacterium]